MLARSATSKTATTTFAYDGDNRLTRVTDPLNHATNFGYDNSSNLLSVTDPLGHTWKRTVDGQGNTLTSIDPLGNEKTTNSTFLPGLGSVPVLGRLFRGDQDEKKKDEIVLSITPRLIRSKPRMELESLEFPSGTEATLHDFSLHSDSDVDASSDGKSAPKKHDDTVANASQSDGLQWQGPLQVKVGENFTVSLNMKPTQPISSLPMVIGYDPKSLDVVDVKEGSFMGQGDAPTSFTQRVDRSIGQVYITQTRTSNASGSDAASPGDALTISFKAIAPSDGTQVRVVSAAGAGSSGTSVAVPLPPPHNIQIAP
ncbi:protein of unknown function (plasmid) [Pararobbsia alpina]|uniref:cohesin domain-containing protein n=1 Tax=Pararobbsia alpina TaxID=621374 RepID=UPI0039A4E267